MKKDPLFIQAKEAVLDNLDILQTNLETCVNQGMLDADSEYYNELLNLVEDATIVDSWDELTEIITLAKTLETDIDAWLSIHGRTSISLDWPSPQ